MGQVINTNTLSLLTQNNLNKSQNAMNTSIERLSSGMRINSAKDDAAGQAIANRFTANIKGLSQAQRNANDGISLAQTTEGALNEINTNLQRIRELTVQSTNGSNSNADKASIQAEITQRMDEIDRTSRQTDFNGVKVLSSSAKKLDVQVGAQDGQVISIDLKEISSATLGLTGFQVAAKTELATVLKANVGAAFTTGVLTDANAAAAGTSTPALFALKDQSGFVALAKDGNYYAATVTITSGVGAVGYTSATPGNAIAAGSVDVAGGAVIAGKNSVTIATTAGTTYQAILNNGVATGSYVGKTTAGAVDTYSEAKIATDGTVTKGNEVAIRTTDATADPLKALDKALSTVDILRGSLGAVQNRFDSVISNLGSTITNLSSSRSRIEDADYATEVSNMTRAQILQQAGTSVLAKANQSTQGVMSLLQ